MIHFDEVLYIQTLRQDYVIETAATRYKIHNFVLNIYLLKKSAKHITTVLSMFREQPRPPSESGTQSKGPGLKSYKGHWWCQERLQTIKHIDDTLEKSCGVAALQGEGSPTLIKTKSIQASHQGVIEQKQSVSLFIQHVFYIFYLACRLYLRLATS